MKYSFVFMTVFLAALLVVVLIAYLKEKSLDKIRGDVYQLFLKAKRKFAGNEGKQKMMWVVDQARNLLPNWLQIIVTEEMFEKILQQWFNCIEDLLDDGEMNNSQEE